ncbi:putative alanine and proline rich protein [Mycobacterium tuberculosis]|nr:putative alanine and proline rich protein [Mycobacterium tuberculosis]
MAPLAVDPAALDSAGGAVVAAGAGLGAVISSLTAALAGCAGMAGDDPAGAVFGRSYDGSAAALVQAMSVARNGLCNLGDGVRMSAHNYSLAEAMSDVAGRAAPLPAPPPSGCVGVGAPPSAVGGGGGAPKGWGWVAPYIGMIWPNGDSTKLRAAAVAWRSAGTQFALTEIQSTAGPMGVIRAQQLPEAGLIESAFADAYASTTAVVGQCHQLAAQLDAYAARIDAVHAAVLDLLARICDPLTGIKEVWEFLTDQDEDEIQRIAHDIAVVVDQFSGEVDALAAEITAVVSHAEAVITAMADHAGKQWDRFLHSNPVGVVIDGTGQQLKGFGEEAFGMAKDSWDLGPLRASIDPFGWYRSWEEMLTGMAPLAGLGGENAPGVVESWKQFGKSLIHWDEWTTNPNEALGKTVFDAATLALPGGPLSKLGSKGRDILAGVRGLKERLEPTTPHLEPQQRRRGQDRNHHGSNHQNRATRHPRPRRNRRPCPPTVHCRTAPPNPNRRPSTDRLNRWRRRRRRQASPGYPQPPRPAHMCRMACRNRVNMSRRKHHRRRRCLADLLSSQRPLPRTNPSGRPHQQHPRRRRIPRPEAFTQPNRGLTADH